MHLRGPELVGLTGFGHGWDQGRHFPWALQTEHVGVVDDGPNLAAYLLACLPLILLIVQCIVLERVVAGVEDGEGGAQEVGPISMLVRFNKDFLMTK